MNNMVIHNIFDKLSAHIYRTIDEAIGDRSRHMTITGSRKWVPDRWYDGKELKKRERDLDVMICGDEECLVTSKWHAEPEGILEAIGASLSMGYGIDPKCEMMGTKYEGHTWSHTYRWKFMGVVSIDVIMVGDRELYEKKLRQLDRLKMRLEENGTKCPPWFFDGGISGSARYKVMTWCTLNEEAV